MGRRPDFHESDFLGAAADLAARGGPTAISVASLSERLGAPTGSFYHRFPSRARLLGELWLGIIESFQRGFAEALSGEEPYAAGLQAALFTPRWCLQERERATILALNQRRDFDHEGWGADQLRRERRNARALNAALARFARRLPLQMPSENKTALLRFALVDAPLAAVRPYLEARRPVPPIVQDLVKKTYRSLIG